MSVIVQAWEATQRLSVAVIDCCVSWRRQWSFVQTSKLEFDKISWFLYL